MELEDLISAGRERIRGDGDLFSEYLRIYGEIFGSNSGCSACTFNSDFERLKRYAGMNKNKEMGQEKVVKMQEKQENTFLIYKEGKIKSYQKDGKMYRVYDTDMTEAFAVEYLTYGTREELEARRKIFKVLPAGIVGSVVSVEESGGVVDAGLVENLDVKPPNKRAVSKK